MSSLRFSENISDGSGVIWGTFSRRPDSLVASAFLTRLYRPLSGSGALGVMTETMTAYGPDSFVGFLVSVMNGSTETTFYVLAVYLGAVRIREARHVLPACLAGDLAGFAGAVAICHLFFG